MIRLSETLKDEKGNTLTEYKYTLAGRIKEIRTSNGITTPYEYDDDGNISRLTIGDGTENRREGGEKYAYALTANGNMDSVIDDEENYCYNEKNELTERRRQAAGMICEPTDIRTSAG